MCLLDSVQSAMGFMRRMGQMRLANCSVWQTCFLSYLVLPCPISLMSLMSLMSSFDAVLNSYAGSLLPSDEFSHKKRAPLFRDTLRPSTAHSKARKETPQAERSCQCASVLFSKGASFRVSQSTSTDGDSRRLCQKRKDAVFSV